MFYQKLISLLSSVSVVSADELNTKEFLQDGDRARDTQTVVCSIDYNEMVPYIRKIWSDSGSNSLHMYSFCGKLTLADDAKHLMDRNRNRLFTVNRGSSRGKSSLLAIDNRNGQVYLFSKIKRCGLLPTLNVAVVKFTCLEEYEACRTEQRELQRRSPFARISCSKGENRDAQITDLVRETEVAYVTLCRSVRGPLAVRIPIQDGEDPAFSVLCALCRDELCTIWS